MGATTDEFECCITHGPWGGSNGKDWVYRPENVIRKISVKYAGIVDSIKFQTDSKLGETQTSFFGGKGGNRTDTICIDYPNEYLVSISGTLGSYDGCCVVKSISFNTNQNCYGPYGPSGGNAFKYDGKGGVIVGFHGCAGKYLSAIGVYVMSKSLALGLLSTYQEKLMLELSSSMSRMAMPRNAGPWGTCGGKPWDDGVFSTIKQIRIHEGELNVIYAIQFEYMKKNGELVLSQLHGGTTGVKNVHLVDLDDEDDYLTGISGFYGPVKGYDGLEAITSINFHTNKKIHGPFGEERGAGYTCYSSTASPGKVVGLHGRDNGFLSKIGVHMEYL